MSALGAPGAGGAPESGHFSLHRAVAHFDAYVREGLADCLKRVALRAEFHHLGREVAGPAIAGWCPVGVKFMSAPSQRRVGFGSSAMQISHCLVTFPVFDPVPMQTSHFRFANGSDFARLMQFRLSMDSGP